MRRPKGIKTKKSAAKRFKITAGGKVLRFSASRRHLAETKRPKRRRGLRRGPPVVERGRRVVVARPPALVGARAHGEVERGRAEFTHMGENVFTLNQATDARPGKPYTALQLHTTKGQPYPTLTRRAQFYIDHEWFLEAGEELPVHKDNPKMGGDYPFVMTSGHNRWSIHSMNITNRMLLQTHRGRPHLVMNTKDARRKGIEDGEEVRVHNDVGDFLVPVKLSPSVMPGQVICYNGWDPLQFREWRGPMDVEPGMVKWLHFAGGYGHLRYWQFEWQPVPNDRAISVEAERVG